jgi:RNA polymerase sigma factor (sigma-70 family)
MVRCQQGSTIEGEMRDTLSIPPLEQAYAELRPLLFDALARLARQGFAVSPADAMDFMHDFFLEAWTKITTNYDPNKGRFESYVYAAFVQFARPRIARLQRVQRDLVDPAELRDMVRIDQASAEAELTSGLDQGVLRRVLQELAAEEREMLLAYFGSSDLSERRVARHLRIGRYKLREQLLTALGKVTLQLNQQAKFSELDWKIARSLWLDQRSVGETAGYLGITEAQVRNGHHRNLKMLATLLQKYRS